MRTCKTFMGLGARERCGTCLASEIVVISEAYSAAAAVTDFWRREQMPLPEKLRSDQLFKRCDEGRFHVYPAAGCLHEVR